MAPGFRMDGKSFCLKWILQLVGFLVTVTSADQSDFESFKKEYCSSEKFEVRCPPDSLLLIHKALFGRMHAGRCVSAEYTHALGCHADVTNYVDTRCTAQQNCSMLVGMFDSISQPCPKDFNAYLEVTHQCIKVPRGGCGSGSTGRGGSTTTHSTITVSDQGYIAISPSAMSRVGTCQWTFNAEGGRKIRFKLATDINRISQYTGQQGVVGSTKQLYCATKFNFHEGNTSSAINLCRSDYQSTETLYSSTAAQVRLEATYQSMSPSTIAKDNATPLLVQYSVFGCHEIIPPEGAKVRHTPQGVAVICKQSLETWWLTCKHDKWIGEFGNCSKDNLDPMGQTPAPNTRKEIQSGIVLAVMVGVVLGVVVGACMLCVIFIVRRSKKRQNRNRARTDELQYEPRMHSEEHTCDVSYPSLLQHEKSAIPASEYEHMCSTYPMSFKTSVPGSQLLKLQLGPQQHSAEECKYDRTLVPPDRVRLSKYHHTNQHQPNGNVAPTTDPMTYYDLEPQMTPRPGTGRQQGETILCDNANVTSGH